MKPKNAIKIMLWLLVATIIFHVNIILKIIPYEITWGGRLKSDAEMYVFETISICINFILCLILMIKGEIISEIISIKKVNVILWMFFGLFVLNTIGNILAKTNLEKFFTFLTLVFSILIWIILRNDQKQKRDL